jgi:hypothetical protein
MTRVWLPLLLWALLQPAGAGQTSGYEAQPTVQAALATYLRILQDRVKDPRLGVYSPDTRRLLESRTISDAQQRAELAAIQAVYSQRVVRENGDLAVVSFPDSPSVPPYFFRRTPEGWTIDLAAASRVIGFDPSNRWYIRDKTSEFSFGL